MRQKVVVVFDTNGQPAYNGVEGEYEALRDFFEGLNFDVERIDFMELPELPEEPERREALKERILSAALSRVFTPGD